MELTRGYSVFANGGAFVPSTAILCVLDSDDNILFEYNDGCPRGNETERTVFRSAFGTDVLDSRIAFLISDILGDEEARQGVMGSRSDLWTGNILSSVKTGTTDNFRDNWTVGYTRNLAVGVWVGNSRGDPMVNSTGLTGAAPIWNDVIMGIYNDQNLISRFAIDGQLLPDRLDQPGGMSLRNICVVSALREPALGCPASRAEWFLDSPAGQFNGVDGLNYPPATQPPADQPPASGPWLREVEPDIYRVLVQPISPEIAQAIQFGVEPGAAAASTTALLSGSGRNRRQHANRAGAVVHRAATRSGRCGARGAVRPQQRHSFLADDCLLTGIGRGWFRSRHRDCLHHQSCEWAGFQHRGRDPDHWNGAVLA